MRRLVLSVMMITLVGLVVVTYEVESLKTGYDIRNLNIKKREMVVAAKQLEYEVITLKSPFQLEQWIASTEIDLRKPQVMRFAKVQEPVILHGEYLKAGSKVPSFVSRWFLGTAQAESER